MSTTEDRIVAMLEEHQDRVIALTGTIQQLTAEVELLRKTFRHFHVASELGDSCRECGLDLRNEVHVRALLARMEGERRDYDIHIHK